MTSSTDSSPIPVHMTLCGKGGVGKSVVARLLTEFLTDRGEPPLTFDADPLNTSFAAVEAFDVERVQLIDTDHKVNARLFDAMILKIADAGRPVVIDTGASSYMPLFSYMREMNLARALCSRGFDLILHVVIAGGPALPFTIGNFDDVCREFGEEAQVVVWLNHYWEQIEFDGKPFFEMPAYRKHEKSIRAMLEIARLSSDTSGQDFAALLKSNNSFAEALGPDSSFNFLEQSRLFNIRESIFDGMGAMLAGDAPEAVEVQA